MLSCDTTTREMLEELCKEDASVKAPEASSQNSSVPMLALSSSPLLHVQVNKEETAFRHFGEFPS